MWYNCKDTLTHNCLFNFIIGNRGGGKTFSCKCWAIDDFLKNGKQFIYLRRYESELKGNKKFFTSIIKANKYKDITFEIKGNTYLINNKVAGFSFALSKAITIKSNEFPDVNKIIFDEFLIDKGAYHYLSNEVECFLEFYETVARLRDVRVFFLGNAITQINPYFLYFKIQLPYNSLIYKKNDILLQMVADADYIEVKKNTRFGKMLQGTNYESYAIENNFLRDKVNMIAKKTKNSKYYFTILYKDKKYGIWINKEEQLFYVSDNIDEYNNFLYAITLNDMTENTILLKNIKKSPLVNNFLEFYKAGRVRFENARLRNTFFDIIRIILR